LYKEVRKTSAKEKGKPNPTTTAGRNLKKKRRNHVALKEKKGMPRMSLEREATAKLWPGSGSKKTKTPTQYEH